MNAIAAVTLVVADYDQARDFFVTALGFEVVQDTSLGDGKRWLVIAPPGGQGAQLLLARASGPEQTAAIGHQAGGRVAFFLRVDDFAQTHARMLGAGVTFLELPRREPYGSVAVFQDICGNRWDLIGPSAL